MLLTLSRTFKAALKSVLRNSWLGIATTSVLTLSLYIIGILILVTFSANSVFQNIQEKANISVYFKSDVTEETIAEIKSNLETNSDIKAVEYVSKDQALEDFKRNNADEQIIIDSLKEIGDNPLLASLVIKAKDPNQYQKIYDDVSKADFSAETSRINYGKNKDVINKLNTLVNSVRKIGIILELLMIGISILIIFNTVRLSIYSRRQEMEIMRLVGASNAYIRLPYVFEGILYGLIATIISMLLLFLTVRSVAPYVASVAPAANLTFFYLAKFWDLLGLQLLVGIVIGTVSGWIAMMKYLKK